MTMCYLNYILVCVILASSSSPRYTLSSAEPISPQCSSTSNTFIASPTTPSAAIASSTACITAIVFPQEKASVDDRQCGPLPVLKLKGDVKPELRGIPSPNDVQGLELLLLPPRLQFGTSQIFVAVTECVEIFNPSSEKFLDVLSISSKSIHFQTAIFHPTTLPPLSRLRMPITFLPRTKQHHMGRIVVELKGGSVDIPVEGRGSRNLYQVKPFTNISIPVDTKITPPIHIYNPGDQPLHIKEIYTTESFLHLTLPENVGGAKLWEIAPHKRRYVINLSFLSDKPGSFVGFIHLSTADHLIILPVEINVMDAPLEVIPRELDFGFITSATQEQVRTIAINNLSLKPIVILGVRTPRPDCLIVKFKRGLVIPPQTTINDAATFFYTTPTLIHADASGKIIILTNQNSSHKNVAVTYTVRIRPGFLRYPPRSLVFSSVATEQPLPETWFDPGLYHRQTILRTRRTIFVTNAFAVPLLVTAVCTEGWGFEVVGFDPLTVEPGGQFSATLYYYQNLSTASQKSFLFVATNLTDFLLPMYVFSGHLNVQSEDFNESDDPESFMNSLSTFSLLPLGGRPPGEPEVLSRLGILNFGHVVAGTEHAHRLIITNRNPIPVTITRVRASSASLHSVFTTYPPEELSEWRTLSPVLNLTHLPDQADALLADVVDHLVVPATDGIAQTGEGLQLQPGDRVMVQISVRPLLSSQPPILRTVPSDDESEEELEEPPEEEEEGGEFDQPEGGVVDEGPVSVWIDTNLRQGDISIRVHAKGVVGHFELEPVMFTGMFPGRVGNESIMATNHYPVPIELSYLRSSDPRLTAVLTASVIQPGERIAIGYVLVIPSQWSAENNYMSDLRVDEEDEEADSEKQSPSTRDLEAVRLSAERWARLKAEDRTTVRAKLQLWSSVVGWTQAETTVELVTPSLTDRTSLQFDLLQVNTSKSVYVYVHNPSDETVSIEPLPPSSSSPFALLRLPGLQKPVPLALAPHHSGTVGPVVFSPVTVGSFSAKLFLKNNLTRLSELQLHGVGGSGHLQFKRPLSLDNQSTLQGVTIGGRKVGLADISRLDINFSRYLPSLGLGMTEFGSLYKLDPSGEGLFQPVLPLFVASVPFFVLNSGNLPFTISSFSLHGRGHLPLDIVPFNFSALPGPAQEGASSSEVDLNKSGVAHHGFYIHGCDILPMLLEPQDSMPLRVVLDPFKLAFTLPLHDVESLHVHTSWGTYAISLEMSVPDQMVPLFLSLAPPSAPESILRYSLVFSAVWLAASLTFQLREHCQAGSRGQQSGEAKNFSFSVTDTDKEEEEEGDEVSPNAHEPPTPTPTPPSHTDPIGTPSDETDEQPEESVTPKAKKAKKKKKKTAEARRASDVDAHTTPTKMNDSQKPTDLLHGKTAESPSISPKPPKSPLVNKQELVTTTILPPISIAPQTSSINNYTASTATTPTITAITTATLTTTGTTTAVAPTATTPTNSASIAAATSLASKPSPASKAAREQKPPKVPDSREPLRTSEIIRLEQLRMAEHLRAQDEAKAAQDAKMQAERERLTIEKEAAVRSAIEREKANELARINAEKLAIERANAAMLAEKRGDNRTEEVMLPQRPSLSFQQARLGDRNRRREGRPEQKPIGPAELHKPTELSSNGRLTSMQAEQRKRTELDRSRLDLGLMNTEPLPMLPRPRAGSLVDAPLPLQIDSSPPESVFLPPRRPVRPDMPPSKFLQPNLRPNFRAPGGPIPAAPESSLTAYAVNNASLPNAPTPLARRVSPVGPNNSLPVNTSPHDSPVMFGQLASGWQPTLATGPLPPLSLRRESTVPQMPVGIRGLKAENLGGSMPHSNGIAVSMMGGMAPLQLQLSDNSPLNLANNDPIDPDFGSSLFSASLLNTPPTSFRNFAPSQAHDHPPPPPTSSIFPGFRSNHSSFLNPLPPPPIGVRKPPPGLPPPGMSFPSRQFPEDRI